MKIVHKITLNAKRHSAWVPPPWALYVRVEVLKKQVSLMLISILRKQSIKSPQKTPEDIMHESSYMVLSYAENDSAEASI